MNRLIAGVACFLLSISLVPDATFAGALLNQITSTGQKVSLKWKTRIIRWRIKSAGAPSGAREMIEAAFNAWKWEAGLPFEFEYAGETPESLPKRDGFCDFFFNVDLATLGFGTDVIAATFRNGKRSLSIDTAADGVTVDGDIIVNPTLAQYWTVAPAADPSQIDLQETLTHEIGHLLGLAHSYLPDAVMFLSKPRPGSDATYKSLFRAPKRTLSQDDIAWASYLYPTSETRAPYGRIEGVVKNDDGGFIGAHIIAVKAQESDLQFRFYPDSPQGDLVTRGMKNVAAFSEEEGRFVIPGLLPGLYSLITQDGRQFLTFRISQVNDYLTSQATLGTYPLGIWNESDCGNSGSLTYSNFSNVLGNAPTIEIPAERVLCHTHIAIGSSANSCTAEATIGTSCGGGGCSVDMNSNFLKEYGGTFLFLLGILILLFTFKSKIEKTKPKLPPRPPRDKDIL